MVYNTHPQTDDIEKGFITEYWEACCSVCSFKKSCWEREDGQVSNRNANCKPQILPPTKFRRKK